MPLTAKIYEGNIYVNIIDTLPGVPLSGSTNLLQGSTYQKWMSLDFDTKKSIKEQILKTKELSLPNLVLKLILGNVHGQADYSQN